MGKLWVFGDSLTAGNGCVNNIPLRDGGYNYFNEYKTEGDDIWPNILGQMIDLETINLGKSGACNDQIIDLIIDNYYKFNEDDIVIVGKTFHQRFDLPNKENNDFTSYYGESLNVLYKDTKNDEKSQTIVNYGVLFCDSELYKHRQNKRFNFLKQTIEDKVKLFHVWDITDTFREGIETIRQHTNNKIKDIHFSFNGHKQMAEIMYKTIFEFKNLL